MVKESTRHFVLAIALLFLLTFFGHSRPQASVIVKPDGTLQKSSVGQVLGKGSSSSEVDESEDIKDGIDDVEDQEESDGEAPRSRVVTRIGDRGEVKTEARVSGDLKSKTEVKEGERKLEVTVGGVRLKIEKENDRFRLKLRNEWDEEVGEVEDEDEDAEDEDLLRIEARETENEIRIASNSAGRLTVTRNRFAASTALPLSVDLTTNQLTVSTPAGTKVVAVLPDQALKSLFSAGAIDGVAGLSLSQIIREATSSPALARAVELKVEAQGQPVYEIDAVKTHKILGLLPVTLARRVVVSAETGRLERVAESFLSRLVDFLSPD